MDITVLRVFLQQLVQNLQSFLILIVIEIQFGQQTQVFIPFRIFVNQFQQLIGSTLGIIQFAVQFDFFNGSGFSHTVLLLIPVIYLYRFLPFFNGSIQSGLHQIELFLVRIFPDNIGIDIARFLYHGFFLQYIRQQQFIPQIGGISRNSFPCQL